MNEEFNTLDKVKNLFSSQKEEEWKSFLILYNNVAAYSGYVNAAEHSYTALLVALGDKGGMAFYKLKKEKIFSRNKNMIIVKEPYSYEYIPKEYIDKVEIKKYIAFTRNQLAVHMRFTTNETHELLINLKDLEMPYQKDGIDEFLNRYRKER